VLGGILSGNKMTTYFWTPTLTRSQFRPREGLPNGSSSATRLSPYASPRSSAPPSTTNETGRGGLRRRTPDGADNAFNRIVTLVGIPAAMKGIPQSRSHSTSDGNGILNVSAVTCQLGGARRHQSARPCDFPYQQVEVIKGIVEMEMKKVRERFRPRG